MTDEITRNIISVINSDLLVNKHKIIIIYIIMFDKMFRKFKALVFTTYNEFFHITLILFM